MSVSSASALLANSLVVGVTGHRSLRASDVPGLYAQVRAFLLDLQARYPQLPLVLLSSLAEGSDQLAAQAALDMDLRVIAPLPLPVGLYRDDFDDPADLQRLERQLQQAQVLELPLVRGNTADAVAIAGPARDRQYAQAGIFVSSHCHVLLALWDGCGSDRLGGTAQVVRFHLHGTMQDGLERRHAAASLLGPDQENVVYHVPVNRRDEAGPADAPGGWLSAGEDVAPRIDMPPAFARMLERQAAFNVDIHKYAAQIAAQPDASPAAASCPVWRTFRAADWLARTYQRRVTRVLATTYVLVALMGVTFFTYTHVLSHDVVIYGFLLLFLVGTAVMTTASRREWQRKYLDYRTLAEGLRVQSYWRRAGIVSPGASTFAHDNFLQKQDTELGWIRNVMCGASVDGMLVPVPAADGQVEAVIDEWIGTPSAGGQLAYYAASGRRRSRLHRRAERIGVVFIALGVGVAVILAVFARQFDEHTKHMLVAVMGILSVFAAVHEAYVHKKADKELIRQYRFMQRIFASAQRLLDDSTVADGKRRILHTLGEAALTEHAGWSLMHRERPLPQSRI